MSDAKKLFVAALKAKLEETKISQAEVARRTGLTPRCINDILKGRRGGKEETKEKIAKVFGMSYDEFLAYGRKILEATSEPFPGFNEVMRLPAKERYSAICYLAAKKYGFEGLLQALGDPLYKDEVPVLENEEEVICEYERQDKLWRERAKRFLATEGVPPERQESALRYLEEKFKVKIDREAIKDFLWKPEKGDKR